MAAEKLTCSAWNGTLSAAGSLATVTAANYNNVLPPGGTATFGFTAKEASTPAIPSSVSCQSP